MGAGTPLSTTSGTTSTKRWWMIGVGTAAILVAGGVASQFWKSEPGKAAEEAAGKTKVAVTRKPASERPMARVNKEVITEEVLAKECMARHGREVLEELINRLIIQQACEAQGKQVTQDEVEQEIVKIAKRFNLDPMEWQKMLQSERNITPEQYRVSVIWPMLALRKLAETNALDDVTEADLEKEFERQYGKRVKCRMILLDNQRHAQEVWKKCRETPDDFEDLAHKHSIDPNSKSLGGQIPPIPRYSGNEAIEKVAFKLKEGAISGLIEVPTAGGTRYAILKCEGQTDPVVDNMEAVRGELVNELKERKIQESVAKLFEQIKSEARVDNLLTNTTTHPAPANVDTAPKVNIKQTSAEKSATGSQPKAKSASAKTPVRK